MASLIDSFSISNDSNSIDLKQENLSLTAKGFLYDRSMDIKDWVSGARKTAGLTQDQLADQLGVTRGNVSGWENGRHEPSLSQIKRVAEICKVSTDPIFGKKSKDSAWPFSFSPEQFQRLPEDKQIRLDGYISAVIDEWEIAQGKRKNG